ncbi:MAG: CHAT domain-containing tetratricopeptide repeat protein [Coleofasciculus sp. D1-CHI-01]|uniref:CHAT domain-containing protein n=1 Tax=Coleofasciculus sp. D1-CHI-01 TaxID=3068482 RepID=UPI0032F0B68B
MYRHLYRLSVVTASLLIGLSCPLPGVGNSGGSGAVLAQPQTREERNDEALRLYQVGVQQFNQGQFREALKTLQLVLGIVRERNWNGSEALILNTIGKIYIDLGEYPQALQSFEQALVIRQELSDKAGVGDTLNNLGAAYFFLGKYSQALQFHNQALVIAQEISDKQMKGRISSNIGTVNRALGLYPQALQYFEKAVVLSQELNDKEGEAAVLNNIGAIYRYLGKYSKALQFHNQALVIAQAIGEKKLQGSILNGIGQCYDRMEQYPEALQFYKQALIIRKEISDKAGLGQTLNGIGQVYSKLKDYPQALEFHQQALVVLQEVGDAAGVGAVLAGIGFVYQGLRDYPKALEFNKQALVVLQEIDDKAGVGVILNNTGGVYTHLGQYSNAEKTLFNAIEVWESLRAGLKDDQKISIFEQQAITYRLLQQALVAQNKFDKALEIAERSRGRALVELLDYKLSQNPNDPLNIKSPTLSEIKQIASEQNATLVQYSTIENEAIYIWVIKPTGEIAFKQVDLESLDTSLQNLVTTSRDNIGVRGRSLFDVTVVNPQPENSTEKLRQLHKLLIAPIANLLPTDPKERVIFIPQASLFLVPFPALQDEQGNYLVEKHTILTAPAIQVLDLTRKQKHNIQNSTGDVLIVGNPTMPKIQFGELVTNLTPLPGAEREANQIADFFNTEALIGSQATKAAVMEKMQQARIIHLATHGLLYDFKGFGVPGAIALAPSGKPDDVVDGLLTAGEIFDMKLSADLVVLSACDTGRGDIKGDGVIGLSRSLISAGVPSILVSLWAVNDDSTAFLMTEFYRNLQQNPDKAVALRQAMLTTMKQYPNPKQWAAFTLIGESE